VKIEQLIYRTYNALCFIPEEPDEALQMISWVTAAIMRKPLPAMDVWQRGLVYNIIGRLPARRKDKLAVLTGITEIVETFARPKFRELPPKRQRKAA
jgi:hypothetical protein